MKELGDVNTNPPPGCKITTKDEDIYNWDVSMDGPDDSIYKGGKFTIAIVRAHRISLPAVTPTNQ